MKPVFQAIISNVNGDCVRACVATITGLPVGTMPNFMDFENIGFDDHLGLWLNRHGFAVIETYKDRAPRDYNWLGLRGMVAMASVPSQMFEGSSHAIVVGWRDHPEHQGSALEVYVAHDPNPNNAPYEDVERLISGLRWIVPLPEATPTTRGREGAGPDCPAPEQSIADRSTT